ncbi:MAG: two-component system histidine kinase [Acidimicrobiaceae bacterium]|nr:two-component system histidine kinase [Acidimicrobiaceae bacterium]
MRRELRPFSSVPWVRGREYPQPAPRPPLLHRITPRQLQVIDLGIAAILVVATGHSAVGLGHGSHAPEVGVLALVAGLSIAVRRRAPITALVLVTIAIAFATVLGESWAPGPLVAMPMYQVASVHARRLSLLALAVAGATLLIATGAGLLAHHQGGGATFGAVVGVAAWFVGDSVRVRRTYVAGLAEQAAQRQREVVERAQRSVAEERLQIARELHDIVAHSLSVIAVQSGVGRHVIDERPDEAKKALAAVEATSRSALDELRRMLGVLRRDDRLPASLTPAPGVSALGSLVEQVRAAGYVVDLNVRSDAARRLSPTVELSIYRIVQEALTNVVKHAGPASVHVEIRDESDALVLEVNDDGRGMTRSAADQLEAVGSDAHHGIVGMRERVALFKGSLTAGSRPEGGFRVLARFPFEVVAPS